MLRPAHCALAAMVLAGAGAAWGRAPAPVAQVEAASAVAGAAAGDETAALARRRAAVEAVSIAIPALIALLHLALYGSYPKARENLFYAASMVCFVGIVLTDLEAVRAASGLWSEVADRAQTPFILGASFFVLLTHQTVRTQALPRTWVGFALAGGALGVLAAVVPSEAAQEWSWYLYFGAVMAATFRLEASGKTVRREGVPVLLAGFLVLDAAIVLQILIDLRLVPPIPGVGVYVLGILAFAVAMSLFLARTFARTSIQLERRLAEVNILSGQLLAQEREAHERELARRLLAAEHARQTEEIEAARAFQLSLVPKVLPRVAGLETAAAMRTASEVGGDYYDFKTNGDGSLVLAVGDATGHGVAAGTMVTAVKAIFSVLGVGRSLAATLTECDRVLRGMSVSSLHMCLTLARITRRSVTVCSAAMPPMLLHRADSGAVEELGAGGLPLGGRLSPTWQERHASLRPGDTLLFASDGLAEALDPAGAALGYEGAAAALGEAAGGTAGEVVERLMERATAWRGVREQSDDVTLVAVRVLEDRISAAAEPS